jgi:small GTP-binding protein
MAIDLKLVLLGHKNVGKTSVFNRYLYDEWGETSMTIGAYFGMKPCKCQDRQVNLAIWDTAGEEKYSSLTNFYCRNARAALVCYDMTSEDSFQGLQRWVEKIETEAAKNCAIVIVGNKLDAVEADPTKRAVDPAEAKRYANSIGATLIEASAKTGAGVAKAFETAVQLAFDKQGAELLSQSKKPTGGPSTNMPAAQPAQTKEGCCSLS